MVRIYWCVTAKPLLDSMHTSIQASMRPANARHARQHGYLRLSDPSHC